MIVILDTNVVLDVLLDREPFVKDAVQIFAMVERSEIEAYLCATTITTVDYLLNQSLDRHEAKECLNKLFELFEIAPVNRTVLTEALMCKMLDYEDAVIDQAGVLVNAEAIITRNPKDFKKAALRIYEPGEFMALFDES